MARRPPPSPDPFTWSPEETLYQATAGACGHLRQTDACGSPLPCADPECPDGVKGHHFSRAIRERMKPAFWSSPPRSPLPLPAITEVEYERGVVGIDQRWNDGTDARVDIAMWRQMAPWPGSLEQQEAGGPVFRPLKAEPKPKAEVRKDRWEDGEYRWVCVTLGNTRSFWFGVRPDHPWWGLPTMRERAKRDDPALPEFALKAPKAPPAMLGTSHTTMDSPWNPERAPAPCERITGDPDGWSWFRLDLFDTDSDDEVRRVGYDLVQLANAAKRGV